MGVKIFKISILILIFVSCRKIKNESKYDRKFEELNYNQQINFIKKNTTKDSILSFDSTFINNQILNGKYQVEIAKYLEEDCYPIRLSKKELIQNFEGFQKIGDIDNDNKDDFVFVLSPLNYCEEGESYYFSNPEIERIYTDSYCCHPNSIFSIGDIDEDGQNEIGQYYSSCASRYKRINVWTLKDNKWKELGKFAFTLNDEYEVFEDFDKLHRKISKGVFQFLEISDVNIHGALVTEWKTIRMK